MQWNKRHARSALENIWMRLAKTLRKIKLHGKNEDRLVSHQRRYIVTIIKPHCVDAAMPRGEK